ncbi:MAG: hypothetical protein O7G83_13120 [Proteobacteria bacterium]|nr:hypothetical protein [Pseudomonadota bacterium]
MALRLQKSLDVLLTQVSLYGFAAEVLLIDWNPPDDRPRLREILKFPARHDCVSVRIIEVEPSFHQCYRFAVLRPVHTPAAFNVGIRRARGAYVLPRVADVFYSDSLVRFLGQQSLSPDKVYRCDRCDVDPEVLDLPIGDLPTFLQACDEHVQIRHHRLEVPDNLFIKDLHTNASGDFLLMAGEKWMEVRGMVETSDTAFLDADSLTLHLAHACGASEVQLPEECCLYKISHGAKTVDRVTVEWLKYGRWIEKGLHHMGLGRSEILNWFRMTLNYPKRRVRGFDGISFDSFERNFLREARRLAAGKVPRCMNGEDWGLGREKLPENLVTRASWDLVEGR